jgi:hypothetical protein
MKPMYYESPGTLNIALLRRYALILLDECKSGSANLLRDHIKSADDSEDLLMMRSAMFECISMHLGEAEAMERIRSLDLSALHSGRPARFNRPVTALSRSFP